LSNSNITMNDKQNSCRPILIIGHGPVSRAWKQGLPQALFSSYNEPEESPISCLQKEKTNVALPRLILWENASPPLESIQQINTLPVAIPLLLRYSQPVTKESGRRLIQALRRRRSSAFFSLPLNFWTPACRIREIIDANVLGSKIELSVQTGQADTVRDTSSGVGISTFSLFDLLDFCISLFGNTPITVDTLQIRGEPRIKTSLDFGNENRAEITINQDTELNKDDPSQPAGENCFTLRQIKVKGENGELELFRCEKNETIISGGGQEKWRLERRFSQNINPAQLSPLYITAVNPYVIEVRYRINQLQKTKAPIMPHQRNDLKTNGVPDFQDYLK